MFNNTVRENISLFTKDNNFNFSRIFAVFVFHSDDVISRWFTDTVFHAQSRLLWYILYGHIISSHHWDIFTFLLKNIEELHKSKVIQI